MNGHEKPKGWWARNWGWAIPAGCLGAVLLPVACIAGLAGLAFHTITGSEPQVEALDRARAHPAVIEALGEPFELGWDVDMEMNITISDGKRQVNIDRPLRGPNGTGRLKVEARREGDGWVYEVMEVELPGGEDIDLLASRGEAPPG